MKEAEAKTKWCPFARAEGPNIGSINRQASYDRPKTNSEGKPITEALPSGSHGIKYIYETIDPGPDPNCFCLTTRCMAWISTPGQSDIRTYEDDEGHCNLINRPN